MTKRRPTPAKPAEPASEPSSIRKLLNYIDERRAESGSTRESRKRALAEAKAAAEKARKDAAMELEMAGLRELEAMRRDPEVMVEMQRELKRGLGLSYPDKRWLEPDYAERAFAEICFRIN